MCAGISRSERPPLDILPALKGGAFFLILRNFDRVRSISQPHSIEYTDLRTQCDPRRSDRRSRRRREDRQALTGRGEGRRPQTRTRPLTERTSGHESARGSIPRVCRVCPRGAELAESVTFPILTLHLRLRMGLVRGLHRTPNRYSQSGAYTVEVVGSGVTAMIGPQPLLCNLLSSLNPTGWYGRNYR